MASRFVEPKPTQAPGSGNIAGLVRRREAGYLVGIGKGAILMPRLDETRPFLPVNIALLTAPARPTAAT